MNNVAAAWYDRSISKQSNKFSPRDTAVLEHVIVQNALDRFGHIWLVSSSVMVLDGPVLALSDIMHGIAPGSDSSVPTEDDPERIIVTESSTPEPLDNAQIELMRRRVLELIVSGASKMNTSSREKELLEMVRLFPCLFVMNSSAKTGLKVIRLTSSHMPDVGQLCTQADMIQELCRQRDFIIKEIEEERARWEAERLGFDRVAEALIGRRSHGGESTYREEVCSFI